MPAALFDVGYVLMDETPRLEDSLSWIAERTGLAVDELRAAYREATRAPEPAYESLVVQALESRGVPRDRARSLRERLPWDRVPLVPYPDGVAAIRTLTDEGLKVGVLANQPASAQRDLERAGIASACDGIWLSEPEGLAKPDPAFFRLALTAWRLEPEEVAYVGDRPDNDVAPARALGLLAVRVLRGPHRDQPPRRPGEHAQIEVESLAQAAQRILEAFGGPSAGGGGSRWTR